MKRFTLLFVMLVFTVMAISSCCRICSNICPSPHDRTVKIITTSSEPRGNRPIVQPWGKELNFLTDKEGVIWEIDQPVAFTITFERTKDPFPFAKYVFTNKPHDKSETPALSVESGPFVDGYDPGDTEVVYKYTIVVDGYEMDPVIIVWR